MRRRAAAPRRLPAVLIAAGACAAAVALALVAGLVVARHPFAFDHDLIVRLHGAGPAWLRPAMIDITALGGPTVLTLTVVAATVLLLARGNPRTAGLIVTATASGSWLVTWLKLLFGRSRPALTDHIVQASGMSFPSGHAANSAIVYLTLAALGGQTMRTPRERDALIVLAVLLVGAIGTSRVYLGVHWPSDVLAGWSFGTLWAIGWWKLGATLRQGDAARP